MSAAMQCRILLLTAALMSSSPAFGTTELRKIWALTGETVILPCRTDTQKGLPTVEWSKEGLDPDIIFLYRDGFEVHAEKNPAFWYRTSLIMRNLKYGDISVRITDVKLSDAGKYTCKTIHMKDQKNTIVELVVGAIAEPRLSVIPPLNGVGLTLQCESGCWSSKPEVTFLDDVGREFSADEPQFELDYEGCFNVTRRVALQNPTNRVTCRVSQPEMNQMKTTEIFIPDECMKTCSIDIITTAALSVLLCGLCGLSIFFLCKKLRGSAGKQEPDRNAGNRRESSQECDSDSEAEHQTNCEDLRRTLHAKDEIIQQLTNELNQLKLMQIPANNPDSLNVPQDSQSSSASTHSCPAYFTDDVAELPDSYSVSSSGETNTAGPKHMSESWPPSDSARPLRRYTYSGFPRNSIRLKMVPEELEQLLTSKKLDQV
ncbi:butyrophilin subfamily 3 member A2-like [Cheilinus undulatus]|uniref:butyrophilin subfamily 3 member A2-like n=1 Tax=Cheilinus undulatus TaxID=241271 RepID=UPI001BD2E68F|nr:butyrophilin subfamily 3 member A2-like [Cheilinus undulatus]